jgi:hypothetical protein
MRERRRKNSLLHPLTLALSRRERELLVANN